MKWTVSQLQKMRDTEVEFNENVDVRSDLMNRNPEIRDMSLINVKGSIAVSFEKATFNLHVNGTLTLPCARTLVDTEYPIDIYSTEIFALTANQLSNEELEDSVHESENGIVDLLPVIDDLILVNIPIQVFSEESLRKGMPSGKDWNVLTEEQFEKERKKDKKVDPRLAGLAALLENEED